VPPVTTGQEKAMDKPSEREI